MFLTENRMEFVRAVCVLVPCLWPFLARRINYVKNLKKNLENLKEEVETLRDVKNDIDLEIARDTSKILSEGGRRWTEKVGEIVTGVNEIEVEVDENRRCLNCCCFPDICSRKRLGKRIENMLKVVDEHNKRWHENVIVDAPPAVVEEIPLPVIEGGETAIERTVKCIMEKITDAKIQKIGLWGMGGVGKTTALTRLNNLPEIAQKFQVVIWVTVSKEGSVRKVQNEIAQRLKMDISNIESEESGARKLHEKLKTMKYLLLLDDLWRFIELEDVGIPLQEGSKVVLTTRNRDVCRFMETDDNIKVECLSKEEAWNLFRAKAGDVVDSSSIESIARDVLEECGGLPLAVVVIGTSLRGVEDVYVWLDALKQLKSATPQSDDTELYLFERLKWSYDRLKDVERECFLYCALYPEDYVIPVAELVTLWGLEGLTFRGDMDSSERLDDADASGHRIVNNLVDASLLERSKDSYGEDCVKMHDVLRDLALWIASSKFLVRAGLGIEECPNDEKKWQEAHRISLMKNKLRGGKNKFWGGLPTNPRCNALATLLLQGNYYLEHIPDMFFQHMPSLRVLDLCETEIEVLPGSVSNLVNLRGLYVRGFNPVDLPREIAALEKLEVLHVNVGSLPLEVRQLTSLRRLWVEFNRGKEEAMRTICSNGVISSLSLLEDLRIYFEYDDLRREWCKVVDDSKVGEEVGRLKRLTRLQFDFSTIECFEHFLLQQQRNTNSCSFPGFKDFHLSMTSDWSTDYDFLNIPGFLKLESHKTGTSLLHLGMENIQRLEYCEVRDCPAMETIVVERTVLLNLKELKLIGLQNLRSICEDPRHRFTKLTKLEIWDCPKLSSCVFTQGMIQHMPNLEVLKVWNCEGIEEIVMREDVEETNLESNGPSTSTTNVTSVLLNLKELELGYLPNLSSICEDPCHRFTKLTSIYIRECPKLSSCVFTQGMIQHMPNLEVLDVWDCEGIKEIVMREDVEKTNHQYKMWRRQTINTRDLQLIFFPKLISLRLAYCQNLVRIWKGASQPWPSIQEIYISHCPNLENLNLNAVDDKNSLAALKWISGTREWWEALKWEDENSKNRLQPLFEHVRN